MFSNVKAEHSLGKGEVLSSILSGSTRNAHEYAPFSHWAFAYQAVRNGTKYETSNSNDAKSVDSVHGSIREDAMADTTAPEKPIEARFETALEELVCMCMDAGMHPADMIAPLEKQLAMARETTR